MAQPASVTVSQTGTWIMAKHGATMGQRHKTMGNLADWSELERSGKLPEQPGRAEAVAAALASAAAKKAAKNAAKPASRTK